MSEDYDKQKIIDNIKSQNNLNDEAQLDVISIYKSGIITGKYSAIISVDTVSYKQLFTKSKIKIGWDICPIYEYFNIKRCFKCNGYNHTSKDCTREEKCSKCAGSHNYKICNSINLKCSNCQYIVDKYNKKIETNHSSRDESCPVFIKQLNLLKNRTAN